MVFCCVNDLVLFFLSLSQFAQMIGEMIHHRETNRRVQKQLEEELDTLRVRVVDKQRENEEALNRAVNRTQQTKKESQEIQKLKQAGKHSC